MVTFTIPDADPLSEVNHCHGPGKGHPCVGAPQALTNVTVHGPRTPYPSGAGRSAHAVAVDVPDDFWVLKSDQGWVEMAASKHYGGPHLSVMAIHVPEDARGKGVGQALYLAAVVAAKQIGKQTWPRYKGVMSVPELRSDAASRAWVALKAKYPKRVKTVKTRGRTYEVME